MDPQMFPFLTGCHRSGTTLLRVIFDAHPMLAIPPESHFIPDFARQRDRYEAPGGFDTEHLLDDLYAHERFLRWKVPVEDARAALSEPSPTGLPDAIRRIYACYARRKGKSLYGDKTPRYTRSVLLLASLFPESRFVHVLRDGRDVALSLLEMKWGPRKLRKAALFWHERVTAAREAGKTLGPSRYYEYRHEDLLDQPDVVVTEICNFLSLPFDASMLDYQDKREPERLRPHEVNITKPPTKGLRDWRATMPPADVKLFERLAGDLLVDLGYERATDVTVKRPRRPR